MALAAAITVQLAADGARRQRAWGTSTAVVVVDRPVRGGAVIEPADLQIRMVPEGMVPEGAVLDGPAGRAGVAGHVAVTDLVAGEILVDARLAPDAFSPGAGTGPDGRIVAIPLDLAAPPLVPGDRVDLVAGFASISEGTATGGVGIVAERSEVVSVDDGTVSVLIEGDEVAAVVDALLNGTVVPAVRPERAG